jgi:hypothetical protein
VGAVHGPAGGTGIGRSRCGSIRHVNATFAPCRVMAVTIGH